MMYFNQKRKREINGPSAAVIRYEEGDKAPTVVAHGRGYVAEKIIELAKQNGVPIEQDAALVQHLLDLDLGDTIPPQLYAVIAEILILIEKMERNY
ncbi:MULTISPECIES: EscU/YscU/HrcU family type III secretion system export apparatus switch protein [Anoxybacillus]|uniref:EscU/YscU/HrcU family type III secretion system export apparatus switch protein n=1 Tax=Anoxybacillus TaxID=150247 RepID=UPI001EDB87E1|nr:MULTISPECIES: EscU/YscU/HrcU family type III secretion system export apparatus switch protein [unclassified Anoxybacillus]MCG3085233.1 EscU/YscU/HrcU family type III secretion system export apparatus switch protein [Anoxybacillus sp. LAT27]MCG5025037.1 EscU/YscU/HrcU family type III secretion system export apparatus switch protein [Anoxybacillus flavithermus]MCG6176138.1 EscU/YscU/HrcU family type III secretion system export apparatus switch protein [Anoxybacillus sp. LAT_31]MCG6179998.1 Esc